MAEYKVVWSVEARIDLVTILEFYIERNGNAQYSKKLNSQINRSINLVAGNPLLGMETEIESVRALITGHYQIIYEIIENTLLVVMVWDNRRNPQDKLISRRTKNNR